MERPAFSAPLYAAVRQGAKELAQVLPAFPSSVHVVEEPGTIGNLPSQLVTQEMTGYDAELAAAAARPQPEQSRELER